MTATFSFASFGFASAAFARSLWQPLRAVLVQFAGASLLVALAACGGSADAPPPPATGPVLPVPPTITLQPASLTVTTGQGATFTVAATGTAPLAYQWQRNGVAIAGATATSYSIAATVLGDSGATFRAVVSNVAGNATSNTATLTVTASAPVLTIAPQPASISVLAGTTASFTVGGTCSSGTLGIQWQRNSGVAGAFANIAGATAASYSFATVLGDSGAQFRAVLDCGGQSATPSNAALLTVTAPGSVTLSLLALAGLRDQAVIDNAVAIDQETSGTYAFITANSVKRVSADLSTIDFVAGTGAGSADGPGATAQFNQPRGITHDGAGNLYVADYSSHTIRRIAADGTVSTIAGAAGVSGAADGSGSTARFNGPWGIALGPDGDLYVGDQFNHVVRRVTTAGVVTTYAGSGTQGFADGAPLAAKFVAPVGIAVAVNGDVLVGDFSDQRVRRIVRAGNGAGSVETLAGNGSVVTPSPDGIGTAAGIVSPIGMVVRGNTLTLRDGQGLVRQIDLTTKAVTTLTGSRVLGEGFADGTSVTARMRSPGWGITSAPAGGFVTADDLALRLISASGDVTTFASHAAAGQTPTGVGTLLQQPFAPAVNRFNSLTIDSAGRVVVADNGTSAVRSVDATGAVTLLAGLTGGFEGVVDGIGSAAQFADLGTAIAGAPAGIVYVADDFVVRRIGANKAVSTLAGSTAAFGAVDGNAATARFNRIFGLAVGPSGDVFVGDAGNSAVRRIDAAGNVTTYAGVMGQSSHVDGPIAAARFSGPRFLAFGPDGSLYVADYLNLGGGGFVRKITPDGATVSTVNAAGGQASTIAVDAADTLYYFDPTGLWKLPAGAAAPTLLIPASAGNNVLGTSPRLYSPQSMAVLGPKQLVLISAFQLLVVTMP